MASSIRVRLASSFAASVPASLPDGPGLQAVTERVPGKASQPLVPVSLFVRKPMRRLVVRALRDEDGQDLIEYAMLAAFISLVAVASITSIGEQVNSWYEGYANTVATIPGASGS